MHTVRNWVHQPMTVVKRGNKVSQTETVWTKQRAEVTEVRELKTPL